MSRLAGFAFYWLPVLAYATLILTLSSQSHLPGASRLPDKPMHALEYSGFAFLLARALFPQRGRPRTRQVAVAFVLAALFAAFDEYYQSYIPGRDCSVYDWLADLAGLSAAISLLLLRTSKEQAPA
ncbi:MAG TPA: VanZ family protein [Acidobacteriota bacterium]|nr:VanZ family protein [Acidobacteriota bacterium]